MKRTLMSLLALFFVTVTVLPSLAMAHSHHCHEHVESAPEQSAARDADCPGALHHHHCCRLPILLEEVGVFALFSPAVRYEPGVFAVTLVPDLEGPFQPPRA